MRRVLFYTGKIRAKREAMIYVPCARCDEPWSRCDCAESWESMVAVHAELSDEPLPEDVENGHPLSSGASFYTGDGA